ncbi:MAG: DUF5947 family protein [Blastocatellia bacterium]|nr:DUF5947 family protein [Blastocatellia bacterium]
MQLPSRHNSLAALRRHIQARVPMERCELCGAGIAAEHQHLFEPASRRLHCACGPCAILFSGPEAKYRRVPTTIRALPDFRLSDAQWESLFIPITMAFFFHSSVAGRPLALYPSPAGATESLFPLSAWEEIAERNPCLREMAPDVEALLMNRTGQAGEAEYFLTPIDECYRLTGLIRAHWRGLAGGAEAWEEIRRFFAAIRTRAVRAKERACA